MAPIALEAAGGRPIPLPTLPSTADAKAERVVKKVARVFAACGKSNILRSELTAILRRLDSDIFSDTNVGRLIEGFREDDKSVVHVAPFFSWLCRGSGAAKGPWTSRHLVLHFDVNKTIVMMDSATGKSMSDIANHVIASSSWGQATKVNSATDGLVDATNASWCCRVTEPMVDRPSEDLVSYAEHIETGLPGSENKRARETLLHRFTQPGEPGECMRPHFEAFLAALRLPKGVVGSEAAKNAGLHANEVFIIPAFFELLLHLKRCAVPFCLVFRTFGNDLEGVATEFNAFCEGKHPMYPEAVFDGRDGGADYRISFGDPSGFGTFFRASISGEEDALVYGTLQQPSRAEGLDFYRDNTRFPDVQVVSGGIITIHKHLRTRTSNPGTLALRDYFPFWRRLGMGEDPKKLNGGKLMVLDACTSASSHCIFFDDNIGFAAPRIVDVRLSWLSKKVLSVDYLFPCHLVKAEPLESVMDPCYFIRHVERMVDAYERRIAVHLRMRRLLCDAIKAQTFPRARHLHFSVNTREYRCALWLRLLS